MYDWRYLTSEEKDLLTEYYDTSSKIPLIFFSTPKLFGSLFLVCGIYETFTNINALTIYETIYNMVSSVVVFCLFWWISNRLIHLVNRELYSLKNDAAQICIATVSEKDKVHVHSRSHHHYYWKYIIKANVLINSEIKYCTILTRDTTFCRLNIGDECNIVYYGTDNTKPMKDFYMTAYDIEFRDVKSVISIYTNGQQ